jgi:peroxiredoxin
MIKQVFIAFILLVFSSVIYGQPSIGSKAPEIALPNAKGEIVKLSSLHGKVVVLDFWASWCGPCRRSFPAMRNVYSRFKDKGLEIYGVSIDGNERAWNAAIQQDQTNWLHVIDRTAGRGNELTETWNLQYIPSTFVINKEGVIVAVSPSKEKLESLLKKLL